MAMDTNYYDNGPIAPEDMKDQRHWFLRVERGVPEPHRRSDHYDRLTRELRNAVEDITDEAELNRFIAGIKLTSKDVEMMVGFLAIHARYFVALSRLAEGYLNALNPPRQTFNMSGQVMFLDPEDVEDGIAELAEHGLESKIREDLVDECGPTVFVDVFGTSDLGASEFLHWLSDLAEPLGGDVNEAGYTDDPAPAPYGNVVPLGA